MRRFSKGILKKYFEIQSQLPDWNHGLAGYSLLGTSTRQKSLYLKHFSPNFMISLKCAGNLSPEETEKSLSVYWNNIMHRRNLMQFSKALSLMKTRFTFPSSFVPRIFSLIAPKSQIANPISSRDIHRVIKYPTDNLSCGICNFYLRDDAGKHIWEKYFRAMTSCLS